MNQTKQCGHSNSCKQGQQQITAVDIDDTGAHGPHQHQPLCTKLDDARTLGQNTAKCSQQQRSPGGNGRDQ
ncbi:hypothetical protein D3C80_1250050 [compost metagenome]